MEFENALAAEIERLRTRLEHLVGLSSAPAKVGRGKPASKAQTNRKPKRKSSPKVRAQRVLQGQYMGHVRRLTAEQKKNISVIREKSGYRKAIAEAKRLAKA
jgi:hypothetical protein